MLHVVPSSSEADEAESGQEELAGGRQAQNIDVAAGAKKRKLERAFLDRGV